MNILKSIWQLMYLYSLCTGQLVFTLNLMVKWNLQLKPNAVTLNTSKVNWQHIS